MIKNITVLSFFALLLLVSNDAFSATITWTGSTSDWGTATNWNTGTVPSQSDDVIIADVTNDPILDLPRTINTLTINTGGLLNLNGNNLTVNGNVTVNGTLNASTGTPMITVAGNWDSSLGTFTRGTSEVILTGNVKTVKTPSNGDYGPNAFHKLTIGSGAKITMLNKFRVANYLTLSGRLNVANLWLTLNSTAGMTINNGGELAGTNTVYREVDNTTPHIINNGTISISNFQYKFLGSIVGAVTATTYGGSLKLSTESASATGELGPEGSILTVNGSLFIFSDYVNTKVILNNNSANGASKINVTNLYVGVNNNTYGKFASGSAEVNVGTVSIRASDANGTNEIDAGSSTWKVTGNWTNRDVFTGGASKIILNGTNQTISGSSTFYNLEKTVTAAAPYTLTFDHTATQTVSNSLTLQGLSNYYLKLRSDLPGTQYNLKFLNTDSLTQDLDYLDVNDNNASGGVRLDCPNCNDNDCSIDNNTNWRFNDTIVCSDTPDGVWTGAFDNDASNHANWSNNTLPQNGDDIVFKSTAPSCTWNLQNLTLPSFTMEAGYSGTVTLNENLTVTDSSTISGGSLSLGNGNLTTGPLTIETGAIVVLNGKNLTVNGNVTVDSGGLLNLNGGNVTVSGNVTGKGTLDASSGTPTITVGGNWDSSLGTFTYGSSTIIFTGSGKTITLPVSGNDFGPKRFYNLEIRGTVSTVSGKGKFRTDKDLIISGKLTLNDTASIDYDSNLFISSTGELAGSTGYFYRFTNDSTNNIDYPGYDNNGHIIIESAGNNKGIISRGIFAYLVGTGSTNAPITATSYQTLQIYAENQETPIVSTGVLGPAGNTLTLSGNLYIAGYRNFTSDFVTLDNSINNIPIIAANGNLTLGNGKATGTLIAASETIAGSASYDFVNVNINNYTGGVSGRINKLDANNSTWNVSGNWAVNGNGVFTAGTSTVNFKSGTTGKTIISGNSPFHNVNFNNASGSWTLQDGMTANSLTSTMGGDLIFHAGSTYAITNLTLNGSSGNLVNLSSTTSGNSWNFNMTNITQPLSYVRVSDSNAANQILCTNNCSNNDRNTNWIFNIYALDYTKAGNGSGSVSSSPAGINSAESASVSFNENTVVTLTAAPSTGSTFTGWSGTGGCTGTVTCVLTMTEAKAATATFTLDTHNLTVTKDGTGAGTVTSDPAGIDCGTDCTETLNYMTFVTFTATPAAGSTFTGWSGSGCSGTGTCTIAMTTEKSVAATFTLETHNLTMTKEGEGTVTSDPAGINCGADCVTYDYGTVVTLTATPAGSIFTGWNGECSGTSTCIVTMTAEKSVTATFIPIFTWTGTVSSSWGDALNWENSSVPAFGGNVIIPQVSAGAYNPVLDTPGVYLASLTIQTGGHLSLNSSPLSVMGDIVNYGTIDASVGGEFSYRNSISVGGSWRNSGIFLSGLSSVTFISTSTGVITSGGSPFRNIFISSGTWMLQDNMEASSLFVSNYATLDTSESNFSLTTDHLDNSGVINANSSIIHIKANSDLDLSRGFNAGTATVILSNLASSEIRVIVGTNPLCNIEFRSGTWRIESNIVITGSLKISSAAKVIVANNVNVTIPGDLVVNGQLDAESNSVFIVGGDVTLTNIFDIGTGSYISVGGSWDNQNGSSITVPGIIFTGGSSHTIHTGGVSFQDVVFNNSSGSWLLQDAITTKNLTITAGTLDTSTSNYDLTVSRNLNIAMGGALNVNGSRVVFNGSSNSTVTMASSPLYNVEIDKSSGVLTLGSDLTVLNNLIIISGTLNTGLNKTLDVGGYISISGTLIANVSQINVAGDWINLGDFICGLSTVTLDGTNQTIWGNNTFYNLIKMTSVADILRFESGKTQTVKNNLTLQGTERNRLSLVSTSLGSYWYIDPRGPSNIRYVQLQDSYNRSFVNIGAINSGDLGHNMGVSFGGSECVCIDNQKLNFTDSVDTREGDHHV